ncbi:uncharacterized protein PV09_03321 [Verruconis gallopava]|uniref:Calpain catalytic domain-containing protein n=1 Tax=Verruconis gallopava TaxID=253628 RepID=A0A0D2B4K0_9PEZI|nr:uncharacterized protein PV09_03321 [Verruconis gallopava]KIW06159.1 hypothetical protein PV09_03321 [Verruconis gallopava]
MDLPEPVLNPSPPPNLESSSGPKHDEFYKYWDRFISVKEKTKKSKSRTSLMVTNSATTNAKSEHPSGTFTTARTSNVDSQVYNDGRRQGTSLEKDVEGRPGHPMVRSNTEGVISRQRATTSYEEAVASCRAKVDAIRRECRRLNLKYYDRLFDLPAQDTLLSLDSKETPVSVKQLVGVGSVKRVEDIYEEPEFFIDGATANDIRQGTNGDCWFLAAITALSGKPELINRICVARDEKVGVYGFVFFRDGEWISEVVDDRLCLRQSDDSKNYHTEYMLTTGGDQNPMTTPLTNMAYGVSKLPQEFRESLRRGSNALYFASCKDSNETWLPLLEKAYAKAHGDYQAIEGGFAGEGVEDLTGGVATYISSEDVLDKDKLWNELLQVNDKFLFGCGSRQGRDYDPADDEGFVRGHAYTVLEAREITKPKNIVDEEERLAIKAGRKYTDKKRNEKVRLLKLRNPWGRQEWNGKWSDGSKEWTPDVMKELQHTFGDDGIFWISYPDFLKFYPEIDRVRLIGSEWTVTQQWTAVNVPYTAEYLDTSFTLTIKEQGPVVLVLSQPDSRYFQGLVGRFSFDLHFRLYKDGEATYLLRSMESAGSNRSCSAELDLEPGLYTILVKITATRTASDRTVEEVIKQYRESRRDKLLAVGKSFDAVHSKGRLRALEENDAQQEKLDEKAKDKQRKIEERNRKRKERQRERLRRKRREAEEKRKKEEKIKTAKEKKKADEKTKKRQGSRKNIETEDAEMGRREEVKDLNKESQPVETRVTPDTQELAQANLKDAIVADNAAKEAIDKHIGSVDTSSPASELPTLELTHEPLFDGRELDKVDKSNCSEDKPVHVETESGAKVVEGVHIALTRDESSTKAENLNVSKANEGKGEPNNDKVEGNEGMTVDRTHESADDELNEEQESCHSSDDEDHVSDCSSVADSDFTWDDVVDGSGAESDSDIDDDSDDDDMFKDDPWRARCVIGLRVCSLDKSVVIGFKHGKNGPVGHEEVEDRG